MHVYQVTLVGLTSLDWQAFGRISHLSWNMRHANSDTLGYNFTVIIFEHV